IATVTKTTKNGLVASDRMVDLVAGRAGVAVAELVAAAAGDVLAIVVMIGVVRVVMTAVKTVVVRVVMTAVRGVRAATTGEVRVGSGSRVAKVGMNVVARVATIVVGRVVSGSRVVRAATIGEVRVVTTAVRDSVTIAVRDSVMIAMMRPSLRRSSVARRCSRVRARASTAKTNRLPNAKIGMSVSSTRARFVASAFGVANRSARSAGRGGIEVARRSQHRPL
ncbi:MAG: hypothetical protein ACKO97_14080, partial [Actinomycetota bacterium]